MRLMLWCLYGCQVSHCALHPGALASGVIGWLGWVGRVELTRLIQHGLKRVLWPLLPLFLLFRCPLFLPVVPQCPLLRTVLLSLIAPKTWLILNNCCHLI